MVDSSGGCRCYGGFGCGVEPPLPRSAQEALTKRAVASVACFVLLSGSLATAGPKPPDLLRLAYEGGSAVEVSEAASGQWQRGGGNARKGSGKVVKVLVVAAAVAILVAIAARPNRAENPPGYSEGA